MLAFGADIPLVEDIRQKGSISLGRLSPPVEKPATATPAPTN
jgi:hypothetical protein